MRIRMPRRSRRSVGRWTGTGFVRTGSVRRGPVFYEIEIFEDGNDRIGLGWIDCASGLLREIADLHGAQLVLANGSVIEIAIVRIDGDSAYIRTVGEIDTTAGQEDL